jgi:antitoxin FitA
MCSTCDNVLHMSKMIQIRNVPDDLHRTLKAKAAARGLTLSDYLLQMAEREATRVTWEEMSERIRRRGRVPLGTSAADIIRENRGPLPE